MAQITMAKALNAALRDAMEADGKVVLLGEDVGTLGGVFRITDGLLKDFGEQRVMDTPLAESGIIGISIGLAIRGYRPVPEMQFDGFSYPALDQIFSHLAKYRNRSRGFQSMPVVVRIPFGGGIGSVEHHSESPETLYAHTAGLKVVAPSTPADAYSLLRESIEIDDPVIFLEPKRRYWAKQEIDLPIRRGWARWRSSICARWCPSTRTRWSPPPARPAGWWWSTRRPSSWGSAPRWPRASPRRPSSTWRRRCCAAPGWTSPTLRPSWRRRTCPASTGSCGPCSGPWTTRGGPFRARA